MKVLVARGDPDRPLEFAELEEPRASATELVVELQASSVNHGEVEWLRYAPAGWRAGWDVSGRVVEAALDGGPAAGTRVVGFLGEAGWAERVAVPLDRVATLPDGCPTLDAAAIPVVGLTALRALRVGGLAAGRRVAVLGASGAIGRVAIQLAARFDAEVTAVTRDPGAASHLSGLGAAAVIADPSAGRYDVVLDGVGGAVGTAAVRRLAPEGTYVVYGNAAGAPIELDPGIFFGEAPEARIHSLRMDASRGQERFGADLSYLAGLVAAGELDLEVEEPRDWGEAAALVAAISAGERPARKPLVSIGA
jgi:NADPH:quinone reductase-like Zn-dependent oxidoreductase